MKVINSWTDKSIDMLLKLLCEAFLEGVNLSKNYYEARKITENLGFIYETRDACPNNCMLFRNEDADLSQCVICGNSRWKDYDDTAVSKYKKKPAKQMRYFPLKPRLQRLFMSS